MGHNRCASPIASRRRLYDKACYSLCSYQYDDVTGQRNAGGTIAVDRTGQMEATGHCQVRVKGVHAVMLRTPRLLPRLRPHVEWLRTI